MLKKCLLSKRLAACLKWYSTAPTAVEAARSVSILGVNTEYTNSLEVHQPGKHLLIYRMLNENGELLNPADLQSIDKALLVNMYKQMTMMKEMDKILYECQRQGRISFYITNYGEEAVQIGSAAGLKADDLVFSQYRESGILHWRGVSLDMLMNQCFGNEEDLGRGKQMPIHYGSKHHYFVTVASTLATQIPHAVGAAYSFKLAKNKRCAVAFFGEGAASEGDTHGAVNFAATLECPVIFYCRNNGYSISTPVTEQYKGDAIAGRAAGYGIAAMRVDGNDVLAVHKATKLARQYVVENCKPILLEAMTYRKGHHSTSDDSTIYRVKEELEEWEERDPIKRVKILLEKCDWWNEEMEKTWLTGIRKRILSALSNAEKLKKPKWQELFYDVYDELPDHLVEQMKYMEDHVEKYKEHYPVNDFKES